MSTIHQIATLVRQQAEAKFKCSTLEFRCHIVSNVFVRLLQDAGIEARLAAGLFHHRAWKEPLRFGDVEQKWRLARLGPPEQCHHCWVEIEDTAWDLTLTQFEPSADPVSVIDMPDERYQVRERGISLESSNFHLEAMCILRHADTLYDRCQRAMRKRAA